MSLKYKFSKHADERILDRELDKDIVLELLENPDVIIELDSKLVVYQKVVMENDKPYLYRVFVNRVLDPKLIVTVYKTSKLEKYENQI